MDTNNASLSLLELFRLGGVFMWPLLAFSIATAAIALDRLVYFLSHSLKTDELEKKIRGFAELGDIKGVLAYLRRVPRRSMGARVLLALFSNADIAEEKGGRELMEKAAETEAEDCVASLENGFNYLSALGSLSPLTGFLGTVSGMIGAFRSIAAATNVNAQIVANGIYEALITTVFGLIIAIVAMVAHSIFSNAVDKFVTRIEKFCSDVIIILARHPDAENKTE
jgi:biopolymer transport protein ExbB